MFVAGIDGGGTHTRLEMRDEENHLLRRLEFGPFNINSIGAEAFRALLEEVFSTCGGLRDCGALCVGAAGISNPRMGEILEETLEAHHFSGRWKLCGDQEIALRGAMDAPGVALIAGTGSICFGKNTSGETARTGGYGHLIDDGGSGYALGRDVLSLAVRQLDGRSPGTAMRCAVYDCLGISSPAELIAFVYSPQTDKSAIARLSALALELAAAGDEQAQEILDWEAEELCRLTRAVQNRLGLRGCPIALLGGLLTQENVYRRLTVKKLAALGTPVAPAHDALWGAAQMAWELTAR
ncbi:MAG TPA: ATPase [Candidatus Faecousia intestinigallinarum]|nr:ATPase [Candidatus Faecousia intestinigallinarum]